MPTKENSLDSSTDVLEEHVSCKATILQVAEFFLYLHKGLKLAVSVIKRYRAGLNHVFTLAKILPLTGIGKMFSSSEKSCPPREIKLPEWNLSLVLRSLTHPPYEPLKLSSDRHLTWKTFYLLAIVLASWVSEVHDLSYRVRHL